jgi:hypothetical protein
MEVRDVSTCTREKPDHTGFRFFACGRELRIEDQNAAGLCGRCLAGEKRRKATAADADRQRVASLRRGADAEAAAIQIVATGIRGARPEYTGRYTGGIVIPEESVPALLRALRSRP